MAIVNLFTAAYEYDDSPEGYHSAEAAIRAATGGRAITVRAYEIGPGQSMCPYHYEYEEEWLLLLSGALTLRRPSGETALVAGDLVCFPPGPDGAHKVTNPGEGAARVIMFSSAREPAVAVYPDSGKIGVWTGNDADGLMVRREDGQVGYWEGEG